MTPATPVIRKASSLDKGDVFTVPHRVHQRTFKAIGAPESHPGDRLSILVCLPGQTTIEQYTPLWLLDTDKVEIIGFDPSFVQLVPKLSLEPKRKTRRAKAGAP